MVRKGVIDFSAFIDKDRQVIVKELSVIDIDSKCTQHWIFLPPQDKQQSMLSTWDNNGFEYHNNWMSTHFHGLYYTNGFTPYENLQSVLTNICRSIHVLFAASTEKARVLEEEIFNFERAVISLELLECPPLPRDPLLHLKEEDPEKNQNNYKKCLFHNIHAPGFYCTEKAVQTLAEWCSENMDKIDLNNPEIRAKTFVNWKLSSPTVKELADQGFIFMCSTRDNTKCIYCGVVLMKWQENDDPFYDHDHNSPFCMFVHYQTQLKEEEEVKNNQKNNNEEERQKRTLERGEDVCGIEREEDVCGCYEIPKVTKTDVFRLCYA
jgi:hypothetical protein